MELEKALKEVDKHPYLHNNSLVDETPFPKVQGSVHGPLLEGKVLLDKTFLSKIDAFKIATSEEAVDGEGRTRRVSPLQFTLNN